MFCTRCGIRLQDQDQFCSQCGLPTAKAEPGTTQRLVRPMWDKKIAGVCGGFALYMRMDPTLTRILWLLLTFGLPPAGLIGYIAAWILMPPVYAPIVASRPDESQSVPSEPLRNDAI